VWRGYLDRIKGGDQDALAALYDQTSAVVFGIAQRVLESRADAEEVALDVYKQIWRGAHAYDVNRGSVGSWLVLLARSRALDRRRTKASQVRVERSWDDEPGIQPVTSGFEQNSVIALDYQRVSVALGALPAEQRQVIEMGFLLGLSHSELSAKLNLPLGTVKTRIRQGMLKLRQLLGEAA
jgi:RNA polymerase sigma-70 factor (ECF subfamily)